ncbi:hypothetical protein HYC85_025552 [Camellia sinensis]|uniref:Uncharacterized protein n=1 Tax=Camellia sinensis TaxID=4442 RepID=A0A7J7GFC0_CAMSI|nr:hypothetical protein HYC85_025552 [Camellia sinensis]
MWSPTKHVEHISHALIQMSSVRHGDLTNLEESVRGIEKIAWDASGDRLALSYKDGDELYKGLIAICDVKRTPLISASLIGFIRGPGDNPRPLAFSFHDKFKQGPLLTVVSPLHYSFVLILFSFPW